ncbi:MAG: hypothetical protein COW73_04105, partial [Nitrospirae bacterium CG18_big_fil_WC_8_21_14_2_50_70_55]
KRRQKALAGLGVAEEEGEGEEVLIAEDEPQMPAAKKAPAQKKVAAKNVAAAKPTAKKGGKK